MIHHTGPAPGGTVQTGRAGRASQGSGPWGGCDSYVQIGACCKKERMRKEVCSDQLQGRPSGTRRGVGPRPGGSMPPGRPRPTSHRSPAPGGDGSSGWVPAAHVGAQTELLFPGFGWAQAWPQWAFGEWIGRQGFCVPAPLCLSDQSLFSEIKGKAIWRSHLLNGRLAGRPRR